MNDRTTPPLSDVIRDIERVSPEIVQEASQYQAAILADVGGRRGTAHGRIAALDPSMKLAGCATTVLAPFRTTTAPHSLAALRAAPARSAPISSIVLPGVARRSAMSSLMIGHAGSISLARQLNFGLRG